MRRRLMSAKDAFILIEQAAAKGARCPMNRSAEVPDGVLESKPVMELVRAGRIRIEVYGHNWRVATILTGPHAGKQTAPPPDPSWRRARVLERQPEAVSP